MNAHKKITASARPWLIACNQAGVSGETHYGFGTLWMRYDRRGDFHSAFMRVAQEVGCLEGFTWDSVRRGASYSLGRGLVDHFFRTPTLSFHCLVVEKAIVNLDCHSNDFDLARRKHFTMLLANKIKAMIRARRRRDQEFRVWVAPLASRYEKAEEAVEVITANIVGEFTGRKPVVIVTKRTASETPGIQLSDLLLGAVIGAWNPEALNREKRMLQAQIAGYLGWLDLRADTFNTDRKFNIWKFYDPVREPARSATTRPTKTG
jgi:hypothetical protein